MAHELLDNARAIAQGETGFIDRQNLRLMCEAFGGREWIGGFGFPCNERAGREERVMALCMAAAILA